MFVAGGVELAVVEHGLNKLSVTAAAEHSMCVDVKDPPSNAMKGLSTRRLMPQGYDPEELANVL